MKARYGRDIYCQTCEKDDEIVLYYTGKFAYKYWCNRCSNTVKEIDRKKEIANE